MLFLKNQKSLYINKPKYTLNIPIKYTFIPSKYTQQLYLHKCSQLWVFQLHLDKMGEYMR